MFLVNTKLHGKNILNITMIMKNTNKLTVPDLISIGVFAALYFVLVAVATFSSVLIFPGFNNVVLPAFCALISGSVYMLMVAKVQKFGTISLYLEKPFASASNTLAIPTKRFSSS